MEIQKIVLCKIKGEQAFEVDDVVAIEASYQVFINGSIAFSFTCTPRDVEEMVIGTLFSRRYIQAAAQIKDMKISTSEIFVTLQDRNEAHNYESYSKPSLDATTMFETVNAIFNNPDTLFNRTGCAHCCALMRNNKILCTFEDIGRHNALDKVIGHALLSGIPMNDCVIFTSGRIPGDYMEKIIHAGFPVAVSRSAVTDEAIRLAIEHNVTLYGFVRGNSANLYNP